jgi:hypothetical protein
LISTALYYGVHSARNKVVKTARNSRNLVGLVLAAIYLFWALGVARQQRSVTSSDHGAMTVTLTLALVVISLLIWFVAAPDRSLALTKAQAQTLLPAPLTSRELLLFKMMMRLPLILWNALIFGVAFQSGFSPYFAVRFVVAYIVVFFMYVQLIGGALVRMRGANSPKPTHPVALAIIRSWLVVATVVAIVQAAKLAADKGLLGPLNGLASLAAAYDLPWSAAVWPFHALIDPAFASSPAILAVPLLTALVVVALEVALVFRTDPAWDRVGIAPAKDKRQLWARAPKKTGKSGLAFYGGALWPLLKRPAAALAWKNLYSSSRTQPITQQLTIVVGVPILLALTLIPALRGMTSFALGVTSVWGALLLFTGPLFVRNDLRMDLPKLRLLRTYPLTSLEICIAEVGASLTVLTLLQLVLLIFSTIALLPNPVIPFGIGRRLACALALAVLLPGMNAINLSAQNVFAVLFPKWVTLGAKPVSRAANPGQFYISLLITVGLFLISMIVPAIAAAVVVYVLWPLGNSVAVIAGALVAGGIALGEAFLVMRWMATLFDRVDLASVSETS